MLTHPGHSTLRLVTSEVWARQQVAQPPARLRPTLPQLGHQIVHPSIQTLGKGVTRRPDGDSTTTWGGARRPDGADELAEAMIRYAHAVSVRSAHLSVPDLRAVTRLLESGSAHGPHPGHVFQPKLICLSIASVS